VVAPRQLRDLTIGAHRLQFIYQKPAAFAVCSDPVLVEAIKTPAGFAVLIAAIDALAPDAPRILLARYAGCLHREHADKTDLRTIDFVDTGHPALLRMWNKRQRGYRAM
jgi:hypothetical protein